MIRDERIIARTKLANGTELVAHLDNKTHVKFAVLLPGTGGATDRVPYNVEHDVARTLIALLDRDS